MWFGRGSIHVHPNGLQGKGKQVRIHGYPSRVRVGRRPGAVMKQGRIHGYRSRMRVGRGHDKKGLLEHSGRSSNAEMPKNDEKANGDGRMDGPTDMT